MNITVKQLFDLFHAWNSTNRAPRTAQFYAHQLAGVLALVGNLPAESLRPVHLLSFKATFHLISAVHRLYRWAIEHALVGDNPVLKLKRPRLRKRRRVLARVEMQRLLRKAEADFRALLLAARETAARPLELRELQWSALRIPEGVDASNALREGLACFVLTEFKGRSRRADDNATRTIPISPRLGRLLLRLSRRGDEGPNVFRTTAARPWSYSATRCRMRKLRLRAKVPLVSGGEKLCLYTLRHTAATNWVVDGVQLNVVSELLGHARLSTTQRYVHLNRQQLLAEWRRHQQKGYS